MSDRVLPKVFGHLLSEQCIQASDILKTADGFFLVYKSLSNILAEKAIFDFPASGGERLACDRFYDDWFLYAVPEGADHVYSICKLREQEYDAQEGVSADGDTPGVTISFISFSCECLLNCLKNPADENRSRLDTEINRVVARRGQRHHETLKQYFVNPQSEGAYLVASTYVRQIASFAKDGCLPVPQCYREIAAQSAAGKKRVPRFVEALNREAGYRVCDNERIYIKDPSAPDRYESAAILATHTGNTSVNSFAAEVEYHARFLIPIARFKIPLIGKSVYESAIRADMSVGDAEFQGPAPFYRADSRIVKRQYQCHKDKYL